MSAKFKLARTYEVKTNSNDNHNRNNAKQMIDQLEKIFGPGSIPIFTVYKPTNY